MILKLKKWPKEVWLTLFVVLLTFYFLTINNMPDDVTGFHSIDFNSESECGWSYMTDEFQVKDVLTLELNKFFYNSQEFAAFSSDGNIFLEKDLLVFFPEKKQSTITILAKNKENSCSKTLKIINV